MKNKKGFTLVELLAVITILGILVTISVVSVTSVINRSTENSYKTLEDEMVEAAKKYVVENIDNYTSPVLLSTLIENGYIKEIKDPANKSKICDKTASKVTITVSGINDNKFTYKAHLKCDSYETE